MRTRIVDSIEALTPYLDAWEDILRENRNTNPYLTPQWIACWWKFFGSGRRLHIVTILDAARPVGFCPLMITGKHFFTKVDFIGSPQAWRMGLVVRRGYEAALIRAALGTLRSRKGNVVVRLHGLCREDACHAALIKELEGRPRSVTSMPCYFVKTSGQSFAEYIKGRAAHHAVKKALSREKALARAAGLSFAQARAEEVDAIFPLHEKHWSRKVDGNGFGRGRQREFFSFLAKAGDHGAFRVRVYILRAGGIPVAFDYGVECGGRFTSLRIAHDDDFAAYRPGMIAKKRMLEACFSQGLQTVDFAAGDDRHKLEWTDECELYDSVEFGSDTPFVKCLLLARRLKRGLRMRLKKSPALLRLKRRGAGRVKYFLSGAPIKAYIMRAARALRQRGLMGLPEAAAGAAARPGGRAFQVKPAHCPPPEGAPLALRTAGLQQMRELEEAANLPAPEIAERYLRGSECELLLRSGRVAATAWVCEGELRARGRVRWRPAEPGDRCVYGIRLRGGRGRQAAREALACLAAQKLPKSCRSLTLLLPRWDMGLLRCARELFSQRGRPIQGREKSPGSAALPAAGQAQNA